MYPFNTSVVSPWHFASIAVRAQYIGMMIGPAKINLPHFIASNPILEWRDALPVARKIVLIFLAAAASGVLYRFVFERVGGFQCVSYW